MSLCRIRINWAVSRENRPWGLCHCHTQRRIDGLRPRQSFIGYDTDYRIIIIYEANRVIFYSQCHTQRRIGNKDRKVCFLMMRVTLQWHAKRQYKPNELWVNVCCIPVRGEIETRTWRTIFWFQLLHNARWSKCKHKLHHQHKIRNYYREQLKILNIIMIMWNRNMEVIVWKVKHYSSW